MCDHVSTISVSSAAIDRDDTAYAATQAVLAAQAVDSNASFGIEEGEVDQLERKWITWCERVRPRRAALDPIGARHHTR